MNEQREIVNYIDEKCSAIDNLIAKKEQYLSEIENYKKSLIYEYVTGKKEVPQKYQAYNERLPKQCLGNYKKCEL